MSDGDLVKHWADEFNEISDAKDARLSELEKQLAERDAALARCVEALVTIELEASMFRVDPPLSEDELMDKFEAISNLSGNTLGSLPASVQATAKVQQWQPIETAPKDKRILLGWVEGIFTGINCVIGRWEKDSYAKKPHPYWTHDLARLTSVSGTRRNQPTHWMPLPEPPETIHEEQAYRSADNS